MGKEDSIVAESYLMNQSLAYYLAISSGKSPYQMRHELMNTVIGRQSISSSK